MTVVRLVQLIVNSNDISDETFLTFISALCKQSAEQPDYETILSACAAVFRFLYQLLSVLQTIEHVVRVLEVMRVALSYAKRHEKSQRNKSSAWSQQSADVIKALSVKLSVTAGELLNRSWDTTSFKATNIGTLVGLYIAHAKDPLKTMKELSSAGVIYAAVQQSTTTTKRKKSKRNATDDDMDGKADDDEEMQVTTVPAQFSVTLTHKTFTIFAVAILKELIERFHYLGVRSVTI